eukprot:5671799-Prorocentrum_lima.AAC.1
MTSSLVGSEMCIRDSSLIHVVHSLRNNLADLVGDLPDCSIEGTEPRIHAQQFRVELLVKLRNQLPAQP